MCVRLTTGRALLEMHWFIPCFLTSFVSRPGIWDSFSPMHSTVPCWTGQGWLLAPQLLCHRSGELPGLGVPQTLQTSSAGGACMLQEHPERVVSWASSCLQHDPVCQMSAADRLEHTVPGLYGCLSSAPTLLYVSSTAFCLQHCRSPCAAQRLPLFRAALWS